MRDSDLVLNAMTGQTAALSAIGKLRRFGTPRKLNKAIYCTDGHYKEPRPGLGYMIFCVAECYLFAHYTNRDLIVDWRDTLYSSGSVNLFSELFEFEGPDDL